MLTNFNSIKVRLEHSLLRIDSSDAIYFNSIKVRLELQAISLFVALMIFQFHKGTIRTSRYNPRWRVTTPFQFHKVTIRTLSLRGV